MFGGAEPAGVKLTGAFKVFLSIFTDQKKNENRLFKEPKNRLCRKPYFVHIFFFFKQIRR